MGVAPATFEEIAQKLRDAGYEHAVHDGRDGTVLDMHGIALQAEPVKEGEG